MPFRSASQRRFLYAKHPEMAAEWSKETPKGAKLPEHVKGSKKRKSKAYKAKLAAALQPVQLVKGAPPVQRLPAPGAPQQAQQPAPAPQPPPPGKGAQKVLTTSSVQQAHQAAPNAIVPSEAVVAAKLDKMASSILERILRQNRA